MYHYVKEATLKAETLYDILKRQIMEIVKKVSDYQGLGRRKLIDGSTENF